MQHIALDLRADEDCHQVDQTAGQGERGGVSAKRIAEEENHRAQQRGHQHGQPHVAPILPAGGAQVFGRLAPLAAQPFQRRGNDEHHQRELEIEIGHAQPPKTVEVETMIIQIEPEDVLEQDCHQPQAAQRGDEGEGQRHAGEVGRHAAEGRHAIGHPARQAHQRRRIGQEETEQPANDRRKKADANRDRVGAEDGGCEQSLDVGQGELPLIILKTANEQRERRQEQEKEGEDQERRDAQPRPVGAARGARQRRAPQ